MKITPIGYLKVELERLGHTDLLEGFSIQDTSYAQFRTEGQKLHPDYNEEQLYTWAVYNSITHPSHAPQKSAPQREKPLLVATTKVKSLGERIYLPWAVAATIIALIELLRGCH